MKKYKIIDMANGQIIDNVCSGNGKAALKKFCQGLTSTGSYEYHKLESGVWELSTSYGRYFQAEEVKGGEEVRRKAVYVSVWDNSETSIESSCVVDLMSRRIVHMSPRRKIYGPYDSSCVDDCVEQLDEQYIYFPDGTKYPVITEMGDDWDGDKFPFCSD